MARNNKAEKIDIRKTEILEHFQDVLREEGFEGASIAKIARKMGVNPSLLMHYFPTKEEMVLELVDFILERYEALVQEKTQLIVDTRQKLETLLNTIFSIDWISMVDTSAFYSCYYLAFRYEKVKLRLQKMYLRFRKGCVEYLEQSMKEGIILWDDPEKLADFIIYIVEGLSFYRNISGGTSHYVEIGEYLKQKVWTMLKKGNEGVESASRRELVRFKKETKDIIQNLQKQVDELTKKLNDL